MVSPDYKKIGISKNHEETRTRRLSCCLIMLSWFILFLMPAEVFGQKENTPQKFIIQPSIQKLSPATQTKFPGGPVAKIAPENLKVKRGESVIFRNGSLSDPDVPLVRYVWIGPANQRGQKDSFEVVTGNLEPGNYPITLEVFDRRNRSSTAKANLEIQGSSPKLNGRVIPVRPPVVVPHPPEIPVARIQPDRQQVKPGERAVFESASTPAGRVREKWIGPGTQRGTGRRFEVDTSRLAPDNYNVILEILGQNNQQDSVTAELVVTRPPEIPVARISPDRLRVEQGERVVFQSASTPAGQLKEKWTGPNNKISEGRSFEISTKDLSPGEYSIILDVADRVQRKDSTQAVLDIRSPVINPGDKEISPPVQLNANPNPAKKGESISFRATEVPSRKNLEYRFDFGDEQIREWSPEPATEHFYAKEGKFDARVSVRIRGKKPWSGDMVSIVIATPSNGGDIGPIAALVAFGAGGGYLLFRRIRKKFHHNPSHVKFNPVIDPGEQDFKNEGLSGIESEMRIRPVTDRGGQDIEIVGSLISEERREYE